MFYFILLCSICLATGCGQAVPQKSREANKVVDDRSSLMTPTPTVPVNIPARLIVPAIQVNASIEQVGILASGDLNTPQRSPWTDVGWYGTGTLPGERGSAVIDGHLDRPGGLPAVFWFLSDMRVGDLVMVVMTSGAMLHFHVTRTAFYPPQDAPLQGIFGDSSGDYLNLITCAGDWIPSQHQTTLRMVVYTTLG